MRVLGIDPSLRRTGLSLIEDGRWVDWLVIETASRECPMKSFDTICATLDRALADLLPDFTIVEGYSTGARSQFAAVAMATAHCAVRAVSSDHTYVTPQDAKLALTGSKKAKKPAMMAAAAPFAPEVTPDGRLYKKAKRPDREAVSDAFGVALAGIKRREQ